jgi:hypothetical protein
MEAHADRTRRRPRRLLVALACLLAWLAPATQAAAWNNRGHMVVAAAAWDRLGPAKARVHELLKLNPDYPTWIEGVPQARRGKVAFMFAATWPDHIKGAPGFVFDGNAPGANATLNVGYADHFQHRYWHYKDLPFSKDGTPTRDPPAINAQERIETFAATLRSDAPDDVKSYDLVWLIHLVGDVHQPLHATSRFSAASPRGDNGGNSVKLACAGCASNLHSYWDDLFGAARDARDELAPARAIAATLTPVPRGRALAGPDMWIGESFEVARSAVYDPAYIGPSNGPFDVGSGPYRTHAERIARERVALAAARLAHLIRENLR